MRSMAVLHNWADWSARQRTLKRLCTHILSRHTRYAVRVAFITWGEALREGRQERAMAERSTERAELEARMEQNAAAASEAAEQIYTAVEAERVTNSKQVAQLQHQLQELLGYLGSRSP